MAGTPARAEVAPVLPRSPTVLLVVDMVNPLQFDGAEALAAPALQAAAATAVLKRRLGRRGVRTVYANDNFGHWHSDFRALVAMCRRLRGPAAGLVKQLAPDADDLMVLKPRHSAFFGTPLDMLLSQLGAKRLVITGLAADLCVQFSATDACVRGFRLWVPEDCTAAESDERKREALLWMRRALKCSTQRAGAAH